MQQLNHSKLLQILVGEAGDYFIGTTAITDKKFSRIKITTETVLTELKIRGVSIITARNYGTIPVGHELVAGGDDYFDHVDLYSGSAIGFLFSEDPQVNITAVDVDGGAEGAAMDPEITFANGGGSGSKKVLWQLRNKTDAVVERGEKVIYFLAGTEVKVTIPGITYPAAPDTGYEFDIKLDGDEAWITSVAFAITEVSTTTQAPTTTL